MLIKKVEVEVALFNKSWVTRIYCLGHVNIKGNEKTHSLAGKVVVTDTVMIRNRANLNRAIMVTLQNNKEAGWDHVCIQRMINIGVTRDKKELISRKYLKNIQSTSDGDADCKRSWLAADTESGEALLGTSPVQ